LSDLDLEDFNMIDMKAKKVLEVLAEANKGEFVKGEDIHKKTGLTPDEINESIRSLKKSLFVIIPNASEKLPHYDFYSVEITDFGREVLEKYK
jgi:hypothetical protein